MENKENLVKKAKKVEQEKAEKQEYLTKQQLHEPLSELEKRIETKLCYELKSVKFDILRWMIPFHTTTLAFMLTMLYRVFS